MGTGIEEKRQQAQANFAAHLFAGVGDMNSDDSDLNLDSPSAANGTPLSPYIDPIDPIDLIDLIDL